MVIKAKNFKQFVTEASQFPAVGDVHVSITDCLFVINDNVYHMDIQIAAAVSENSDIEDRSRPIWSQYSVKDWWLYDIEYCMKFKDPKAATNLIEDINKINRLIKLGLANNSSRSAAIDKIFANYQLEEISTAEHAQIELILEDQLQSETYNEILYKSNESFMVRLNNMLADEVGDRY